jgi:hypothetical protein
MLYYRYPAGLREKETNVPRGRVISQAFNFVDKENSIAYIIGLTTVPQYITKQ